MSASNWAVCPRCLSRARKAQAEALAKVTASYGKVPMEEFDRARAAIETPRPADFTTFREDYEIDGAAEGKVEVHYSGGCRVCGLALDFTDERLLPVRPHLEGEL